MNFRDNHKHFDRDGYSHNTRQQSNQQQHATEELSPCRQIAQSRRQTQPAYHLQMTVYSAEDLGIAVRNHNDSQYQPQRQQRKEASSFEKAQHRASER